MPKTHEFEKLFCCAFQERLLDFSRRAAGAKATQFSDRFWPGQNRALVTKLIFETRSREVRGIPICPLPTLVPGGTLR